MPGPSPRVVLASCSQLRPEEVDDRPFWAALRGLGADVTIADWADPRVAWSGFHACLIRTTWDYQQQPQAFLDWARRVGALLPLYNPVPIVEWNLDKRYLADLQAWGFPIVPTVWLAPGSEVDVAAECRARGWARGFVKPRIGANAFGTLRFDCDDAGLDRAQAFVTEALSRGPQMLQPYLPSVERRGELSLIYIDGQLSHATRKIPAQGDYRVQDDWGATDAPEIPSAAAKALGDALAQRLRGPDGAPLLYARLDLIEADDGSPLIVEHEIIEPSLFFRHDAASPGRLARAFLRRISAAGG